MTPPSRAPLSVVLIAKNAASQLGPCLASAAFADEMAPAAGQPTTPDVDARKGDPVVRARYSAVVQERVRDALCRDILLRPGRYRIAVQFWIAPTGSVQQTRLLSKTGDDRVDRAIEATLRALRMNEAPPPGISQPLTMVVAPRPSERTLDCAGIDAIRTTGGVN